MSAVELVLLLAAGWMGLAVVTAVFVLPLLSASSRSDALMDRWAAERLEQSRGVPAGRADDEAATEPEPVGLPSLRESGYLSFVLERLALHARAIFGADEVCVFVRDSGAPREALMPAEGVGVHPDLFGRRFPIDWGPVGAALAYGRPLAAPGQPWPGWRVEHDAGEQARSAAVAPVCFGGSIRGALSVAYRSGGRGLGVSELALLGELAELVGHGLAHTERRELSAADPQVEIEGLLATLALIGPDMDTHGAEVAEVARLLADDLGLDEADRLELELGARFHDVGKLRVPPHILRKTSGLSESEWEVMRLHPLWGAEMVASIPGLEAVAAIVRFHHERWDGGGYPDGLVGKQIPLASRVITLCDAFSAMTSDRPYRRALERTSALRELDALAGTQFDPDLTARLTRATSGAEVRRPA